MVGQFSRGSYWAVQLAYNQEDEGTSYSQGWGGGNNSGPGNQGNDKDVGNANGCGRRC
jgi:hypothetical protein